MSHQPDERVETADMAVALEAVAGFVQRLAHEEDGMVEGVVGGTVDGATDGAERGG